MGLGDVFFQEVTWFLVSQDDGHFLEGQFPPQSLVENVSGAWGEQATLGLDQPILQFLRGEKETISCDVKVWAEHQGILGTGLGAEDIQETVDEIRDLPRADPDLGRPHVYLFSVGEQFSQQVIVKSVGAIRYDRMRSSDGTLRGVLFSFELWRYEPYSVVDLVTGESLIAHARQGDSYESIAWRVLGDAILGEALRRRNPDRYYLEEGDEVHVPKASILRAELDLNPQSLPLKSGDAQRQLYLDTLETHGVDYESHIVVEA
jgi:hypothetical protein